ncbi:hypothetical protein C8R45DRAFT_1078285 [Mycena sanguinolenta]|nr:hypothetical protein C8R45DRAFT_1078285 [Mycena sanguinolenta]
MDIWNERHPVNLKQLSKQHRRRPRDALGFLFSSSPPFATTRRSPEGGSKRPLDSRMMQRLLSALPLLTAVLGHVNLVPCASTCIDAVDSLYPTCDQLCMCTDANVQFSFFSCVQGECQATDLDNAHAWLDSGCISLSLTNTPTATAPFLPANSNADIEVHTSSVSSSATSGKSSLSEGPPTTSQAQSTSSQTGSTSGVRTAHRKGARTGAIAASVVGGMLIISLVIFLLRTRRRRQRIRDRRIPTQFTGGQKDSASVSPGMKAEVSSGAQFTEAPRDKPEWAEAAASRETELKHGNIPSTDSPVVDREEPGSVAPLRGPEQPLDQGGLTSRLRRVEAQLEALLAVGSRESLPPSYSG